MHRALWIGQAALAIVFLATGLMKLVMPMAAIEAQMPAPLPPAFIRFLGAAEFLGALGMILPGLLRIRPWLTPLAAAGLLLIMIGATTYTALYEGIALALMPFVVGVVAAFVAYGRWRLVPLGAGRGVRSLGQSASRV
jgi:hypothetical protein